MNLSEAPPKTGDDCRSWRVIAMRTGSDTRSHLGIRDKKQACLARIAWRLCFLEVDCAGCLRVLQRSESKEIVKRDALSTVRPDAFSFRSPSFRTLITQSLERIWVEKLT
eukprot:1162977-Rhodomonas_salina.2